MATATEATRRKRTRIQDLDDATILEFCEQTEELEDIAEAEGVELTNEDRERLEDSIVEAREDEALDEDNLDDDPTIVEDRADEDERDERGLSDDQRFFLRAQKQEEYVRRLESEDDE